MADLQLSITQEATKPPAKRWHCSLAPALAAWGISLDLFWKVAGTYFSQIILAGFSLASSIVVARLLGPAGRGEYAVAAAIGIIGVQFGSLGLPASNTYYLGRNRQLLSGLHANSIVLSFAVGGSASAVFAGVVLLRPALAPVHGLLLVLALCWVPFGLAYLLNQYLLVGLREVRAFNLIELANKVLALSLIGCLLVLHGITTDRVFAVTFAALLCSLSFSFARLRRLAPGRLAPSLALFRQGLGLGLRAQAVCFLGFILLRVDLLMVKYMLGSEQAGYYSIAANMADYILLLPTSLALILFPKLSAMEEPHRRWGVAGRVTWGAAALLLPLAGVCALLARPIVQGAFGKAYLPSVTSFLLLLPGVFCLGLETVMVQFLNSIGLPLSVAFAWLAACVTNIAINLWAIPHYGISGASMASTICYCLILILVLSIVRRERKRSHSPRTHLQILASAIS